MTLNGELAVTVSLRHCGGASDFLRIPRRRKDTFLQAGLDNDLIWR